MSRQGPIRSSAAVAESLQFPQRALRKNEFMKPEDKNEGAATEPTTVKDETEQPSETEEAKLLLGKRVLRHFGVRSDVQAGTYSGVKRCR
jgi:hypothetical protein